MGQSARLRGLSAALFTLVIAAASPSGAAPVLWSSGAGGNDHYYELFLTTRTFAEAQAAAVGLTPPPGYGPGYLVTITSQAEQDFIFDTFGILDTCRPFSSPCIWIGAGDAASEGTWKWVTGPEAGQTLAPSGTGYANWYAGEPNNNGGAENCAIYGWNGTSQWNDVGCSGLSAYLVEWSPASCVAPPAGMVSWWRADGTPNDSQSGHDGALQNGATFAPGIVGQAFSFDGADDQVLVLHSADQNLGSQLTIDAWLKPTSLGHGRSILQKRSASNVGGYVLETTAQPFGPDNGLQLAIMIGGTYRVLQSPANVLATGVWQHVAVTYDGAAMKIYLDGVEVATVAQTGAIDAVTDPMVIGRNVVFPVNAYHGLIDELELIGRALSASEIKAIYDAGSAGKCALDHFLCYKTRSTRGDLCASDSPSNPGAPCESEEFRGGETDETSYCVPDKFPKSLRVLLSDPLEPGARSFDVKKPVNLCAPADKNGEGVLDADTHLEGYQIALTKGRCDGTSPANAGLGCRNEGDCGGVQGHTTHCVAQSKSEKQLARAVTNPFHPSTSPLIIDAIKPDRLLVPTAKSLTAPPDAPGASNVDHYTCYKASVSKGAPKFVPINGVQLDDQFTSGQRSFDLKKPTRLCLAADKNAEGIAQPQAHLLCYQAAASKGQPKFVKVTGIFVHNQLDASQVDATKEEELCVPSALVE